MNSKYHNTIIIMIYPLITLVQDHSYNKTSNVVSYYKTHIYIIMVVFIYTNMGVDIDIIIIDSFPTHLIYQLLDHVHQEEYRV